MTHGSKTCRQPLLLHALYVEDGFGTLSIPDDELAEWAAWERKQADRIDRLAMKSSSVLDRKGELEKLIEEYNRWLYSCYR